MEAPSEFELSLRSIAVALVPEGIGESFFEADAPVEALEVASGDDSNAALGPSCPSRSRRR
jgi:hypothetical protein